MNKYIDAMRDGAEVVVIASDPKCSSAIFWINEDGNIVTFSRHLGIFERDIFDGFTLSDFEKHIQIMEEENALIFIRGC